MKKIFKWLLIAVGTFVVLIAAAVIIIPQFIDVQKYKPVIEQKITQATGRTFTLGDEIELSVFPWVGVKLTDLHFSSGAGYNSKDMVSVEKFEVRLKVMPLLSKQIEVKTFVLDSPKIFLERLKNGNANWQIAGEKQKKKVSKGEKEQSKNAVIPIESLSVGNFSITNGQLTYIDHGTDLKKEISDFNLNLKNISLENPIGISFNASIDGKPVSLEGTAGPIGKNPGKGTVAIDLVLKALEVLEVKLSGNIIDPLVSQTIDFELNVMPFSPKKLFAAMGMDLPVQTKDPKVLNMVSLKTHIKGNPKSVAFTNGQFGLDDSKLNFSAAAKDFLKPDLKFDIKLDNIDLDRYLPESQVKEKTSSGSNAVSKKGKPTDTSKKKIDYAPLRKLKLDGKLKIGKLTVSKAVIEDVDIHIVAKKGIITVDPMGLKLYQGSLASKLEVNVKKNNPRTKISINGNGIQAGELIKDVLEQELIEGTLKTKITLSIVGDKPDIIKKTLNGKGEFLFTDGALIGVDLANLVRNIGAKVGLGEEVKEKPRTDFASLKIPFTVRKGLVNTNKSSMISPLLRVLVKGNAHLVKETLDFRVEPKFVSTLKGQGDTKKRSGVMVPVLITGSFSSVKIRPDLAGMLKGDVSKNIEELTKGLGSSLSKDVQNESIDAVKEDTIKQLGNLLPSLIK